MAQMRPAREREAIPRATLSNGEKRASSILIYEAHSITAYIATIQQQGGDAVCSVVVE